MKRRRQAEEEEETGSRKSISISRGASHKPLDEEPDVINPASARRRSSRNAPGMLEAEDKGANGDEDNADSSNFKDDAEDEAEGQEDGSGDQEEDEELKAPATTPKRGRGRPKPITAEKVAETPKKDIQKKLFATPSKVNGTSGNDTPRIHRNADRSARRKSNRNLIDLVMLGNISDNDEGEEEIAQEIYNSEDDGGLDELQEAPEESNEPVTPSKRGPKKSSKRRPRSPTPPQDLTAHEKYFYQNRGGRVKTSNNSLASLKLLDHEEYFSLSRNIKDPHSENIKDLQDLHVESFNQWQFELSQDFSICIYGYGSKRALLMRFADKVYKSQADHSKSRIVVVNGYVNNLTVKDVLHTVATAITERGHKLGSQPAEMLDHLIALLEEDQEQDITLIIHSIDRVPLRKPATQTILSRLSSHPQVHLITSADHPSFPLLWDSSLRSTFNFLFHDCTTFQPYTAEIDVVDEVHELLGRSGRRVGGKEGVSFVLKSLPENAKNLFRVLIGEQLATMDESSGAIPDEEDGGDGERRGANRNNEIGVEYRVLYQKAQEEFICSNEMNFRTLLKE
jgi:origin recognition complex subunit 2